MNQIIKEPSTFFFTAGWLLSMPASFQSVQQTTMSDDSCGYLSPLAHPVTCHMNLNVIEKSSVLPWVSNWVPTSQMYRKLNIANWLRSFLSGSTSAISGPSP